MNGLTKTVIILTIFTFLSGCASTPREKRIQRTLDCTKNLIEYDAATLDAYEICKDLHG